MACTFGSARGSYGNTSRGDQSGGKEIATQSGYIHSKGWFIVRAKSAKMRERMAYAMDYFCNRTGLLLGYSQPDRMALYNELKDKGFDPTKLKVKSNCDCSSLTRVCMLYAGSTVKNFTTANMRSVVAQTGEFEIIEFKSLSKVAAGDALCTKTKGHVVICTKSDYTLPDTATEPDDIKDAVLYNGSSGSEVKELQSKLIQLGYDLGRWGADGEFGDATEMAVRSFQSDAGIPATGIADDDTIKALDEMLIDDAETGTRVMITGGNCYKREEPNSRSKILGIAFSGTSYLYAGETSVDGWYKIIYNGVTSWVSGRYGKLV